MLIAACVTCQNFELQVSLHLHFLNANSKGSGEAVPLYRLIESSNILHSLFSNKRLFIRAGIHKMLVRIANREVISTLILCADSDDKKATRSSLYLREETMKYDCHLL